MNKQLAARERAAVRRWIEPNPARPGAAEAWVLPACVSVWVVIRQLQLEGDRSDVVAVMFELPIEAIEAARTYYERNRAEIDERIARNRAFFTAR